MVGEAGGPKFKASLDCIRKAMSQIRKKKKMELLWLSANWETVAATEKEATH